MLSKHDELLLRDLKLQPVWLMLSYVGLGLLASTVGVLTEGGPLSKVTCLGGGFLVALGSEKLVSRRIRMAALALLKQRSNGIG